MSEFTEDEDLKEAIRLSMLSDDAESVAKAAKHVPKEPRMTMASSAPIIILDDSSDEEEPISNTKNDNVTPVENTTKPTLQAASANFLHSLNRQQMEKERLARHKRSLSDDVGSDQQPPAKTVRTTSGSDTSTTLQSTAKTSANELKVKIKSKLPFLDGTIRKTYANGFPRQDDIKIEEIFEKDKLRTAVLSAFQWDFMWLFDKIRVGQTKLVLVLQGKDDISMNHFRQNLCHVPQTRLVFPSMENGVNLPSANLTKYDWGEANGIMENSVFIIDFPQLPVFLRAAINQTNTEFSRELLYFCQAKEIPEDVLVKLARDYDFSRSAAYAFIHSIGGHHYGENARRTGFYGLSSAVKKLHLKTRKELEVHFVTSSLGALNKDFLLCMYRAMLGEDPVKRLLQSKKKPVKANAIHPNNHGDSDDDETTDDESDEDDDNDTHWQKICSGFRIYFPSKATVNASRGGSGCGGTICFQSQWYNRDTFPKHLLRDCVSVRTGMLMHNKMIFVKACRVLSGKYSAWGYIGSANLSESAWGKLTIDRATKSPKMYLRNWECGVLYRIDHQNPTTGSTSTTRTQSLSEIFDTSPVPMVVPGAPFTSRNAPWFFAEQG